MSFFVQLDRATEDRLYRTRDETAFLQSIPDETIIRSIWVYGDHRPGR